MATSEELTTALAAAHAQVRGIDWTTWQVPPGDARLAEYQSYWAARAELLAKTGAYDDARRAYDLAIGLERDPAVRRFLQGRRSVLPELHPHDESPST